MEQERQEDIGFIFLHGAGLGAWIWTDLIKEMKYPTLAIDFPGRGRHKDIATKNLSLNRYVDSAITDMKSFAPGKLIIVAHSIGGVVGLEMANILKERICGFVAVGASIPAANGSYISSFPFFTGMIFRLMIALAGTKPPESALRNGLCNDLTEEQTSKIINLFIPESKKLYTDRLSAQKPPHNSMYLRLKKDNAFSESVQNNMIANLKTKQIIDIESGHLAMLAKPGELANILNGFAAQINEWFALS